ncbi:hypothetical protein GWI33_019148 [Rhynchophorus ferrugineus]|uniref:Uncharacterized protein n=1 Tax=Rhynchophorus ferrugineus TaxID=354439 RepID=A0A834M7B7_RHYFE|nr:hypothetical protein GWI33_019148 [Rhynchophorus ferrugineus]
MLFFQSTFQNVGSKNSKSKPLDRPAVRLVGGSGVVLVAAASTSLRQRQKERRQSIGPWRRDDSSQRRRPSVMSQRRDAFLRYCSTSHPSGANTNWRAGTSLV